MISGSITRIMNAIRLQFSIENADCLTYRHCPVEVPIEDVQSIESINNNVYVHTFTGKSYCADGAVKVVQPYVAPS